jgi:hypothetical protein
LVWSFFGPLNDVVGRTVYGTERFMKRVDVVVPMFGSNKVKKAWDRKSGAADEQERI